VDRQPRRTVSDASRVARGVRRNVPAARIALGVAALLLGGALLWFRLAPQAKGRERVRSLATASAEPQGFLLLDDGRLPNVLLLTVDTLRGDHVSSPSFAGLTPVLDRLAARGTRFVHTTSPAPATLPALAALHTGSYLHRHRVASNFGWIPAGVPLLAEELLRAGYVTAAFYGNQVLKPTGGLGRGFATYTSFVDGKGMSRDRLGVQTAIGWLNAAPREPWFLWLHLMSPHGPYNSAPRSSLAARLPDPLPDAALERSKSNYGLGPMIPRYQIMQIEPRAKQYRRRYRDEVVFVDAQIGDVLTALEARGLRESTVVVFTADHGEGLGEHDYFFQHGWLTNEPSVHVPMIWHEPGRISEGHVVTATTSLVDVVPTLLAGLGLHPPPVDGRNLGAALAGEPLADGFAFTLTAYLNQVAAVRHGPWKLVHTPPPPHPLPQDHWHRFYQAAERWVLHDLARDPGETIDLAHERPEVLAEWERRNGLPSGMRGVAPSVDAESLERLRALGYAD